MWRSLGIVLILPSLASADDRYQIVMVTSRKPDCTYCEVFKRQQLPLLDISHGWDDSAVDMQFMDHSDVRRNLPELAEWFDDCAENKGPAWDRWNARYNVMRLMPAFVLLRNGDPVWKDSDGVRHPAYVAGYATAAKILEWRDRHARKQWRPGV